jgi:pimeloyl-ACP methyl ester carboxylesterase
MSPQPPINSSGAGSPSSTSDLPDLPGFTHAYADVNNTRIHYVSGGTGPTTVLLHGWPYTWAVWRRLMPLLAETGLTVIAADLRGLGQSALENEGYSKSNVAEDIFQLTRLVGHDPINLIGADIGAMVAYAYAAAHPNEVRRLVLSESIIPGFGLEERMNPATGGYWHFGFHLQVELATFLTTGKEAAYLQPMFQMGSTAKDALEIATESYLPYYTAPGRMRAGFQHYGTLLEDGKENRARFRSKLTLPVLVLSGEFGIPHAQTLESVQHLADQVQAGIVPASGHLYARDNPSWTAARLAQFFA